MVSTLPVAAVDIRGAEKYFGNVSNPKLIFTHLNLTVPRGNIYGLLGPSGCGKTTLLRCMLGQMKLDKGSITVLGHTPGSKESGIPGPTVGYMSQEANVYLTMTIGEYLHYFGTIFRMSPKKIQSKTEYFIDLLRLPPKDTLTCQLSGGQLRRVQFSASLIHDPKLIILDEPTVGIDVITKQSMWEHLTKLIRKQDTSIILTTHYIEEARLADRVGMVHGCTMAAEDTTDNLLKKYNENTLEGVFLRICSGDFIEAEIEKDGGSNADDEIVPHVSESLKNCDMDLELGYGAKNSNSGTWWKEWGLGISWHRLYPTMLRIFISLYRVPGVVVLLALLPSSQVILYTYTMGRPIGGIQLITINEDVGPLGAQYLSYLDPEIIYMKSYRDYDDGQRAFEQGVAIGILHIKFNFSAVFHDRYSDFALTTENISKYGTIDLKMDNTNLNIAKFAEFHILEVFQHFLYDTLNMAGINPMVGQLPINISKEIIQGLTRPPNIYVLPGLLTLASYFSSLPIAVFNIFMDKHRGYMEANLVAGVTYAELVCGVFLVQLVILVIQDAAILLSAMPLLSTFSKGSLVLLFFMLYVQGIGGTALGIFISFLFDGPELMFGFMSITIFFSPPSAGLFWPIESMPTLFRQICQCLPLTMPSRAIDVIIHRGWDLRYPIVASALGISFLWILFFLFISFCVCRLKK